MNLNCEILSVGTELLLGNITNTNARFLSEALADIGVNVLYHSVVGDNEERLTESFNLALSRCDVVILTGGLGPTTDDITKETVFKALGLESQFNENCYNKIVDYFKAKGKNCPDNNKKQAYFPKEAIICENNNGTAPGCIIPLENKTVVILPGPPKELKPMFKESVKPYLEKMSGSVIYSKTINLFGIGESEAEEKIAELTKGTNPTVAFYAKTGRVQIRVTAKAESLLDAQNMVLPLVKEITDIYGEKVYGFDNDTLQSVAVNALKEAGKTVTVAESCTGGLIAKKITDIPGASSVFEMGFCTYSNEAKIKFLKVNKKTIKLASAISGETARLMAEGAKKQAHADFGLATTGLAGPDTDESGKPVGTVYIAVAYKNHTVAKKLFINRGIENDRDYIREITSMHAFDLLIRAIKKYCGSDEEVTEDDILGETLISTTPTVSENIQEEPVETKTDAFMALLNERKIADANGNPVNTEETKTIENPIKEVLESENEIVEVEKNETIDNPLTSTKKSYNFELFE